MAFVPPTSNVATAQQQPATGKDKTPKTTIAYVNHYLKLKDGSRVKMHSDLTLRLYAERRADAKLVELIKAGQIPTTFDNGFVITEFSLARDENEEIEFDF